MEEFALEGKDHICLGLSVTAWLEKFNSSWRYGKISAVTHLKFELTINYEFDILIFLCLTQRVAPNSEYEKGNDF